MKNNQLDNINNDLIVKVHDIYNHYDAKKKTLKE